ncbi:uncharacterized protein C5L36_0A01560 [Pichia kudriavzevii]|uniref:Pyruvate decarboxylase isozyme 3 n=2 Tax=Pichia kudriavzevii TaxID=4909 RepID=A0A099P7E7_PICKU|nr:uncharacterized protein C5L36_0A01560 [Pichia kudriavzevii]AWU73550.1 hypothetical protein C5L36_0A01560 [Pichia kudriavzevii]KGK39951.1 hypothetical protein JL09_g917 [Pichia kudriavzevii]ONH71808.1 Pyruvate decarboxylase isozyme 3 [Pichia kudriavzevii]
MTDKISLGTYLFEKLKEAGSYSIFGVPGDFNLALLDHVKEVEGIRWVGNANELNAGYEADGYARINGFASLITTFGVGELSAVNAIAGSYAEHVPLIHIVGMPSLSAMKNNLLLHHTLGDTRFDNFTEMSKKISAKVEIVYDLESAPKLINNLIETAYHTKRPVYLGLPSNFADELVPAALVKENKLHLEEPLNNPVAEEEFIHNVVEMVKKAEKPIILVDACAARHNISKEVRELAKLTKFPVFTTPMGKSTVDEDDEEFFGLYLGSLSAPDVKDIVGPTDCILSLGGLPSDFNTGSFSYGYTTKNVVEFHSNYCKFKSATYENLMMKGAVQRLISELKNIKYSNVSTLSPPKSKFAYESAKVAPEGIITQDYLWKRLSYFLKPRDIIVTETGTSSFGVLATHLPRDSKSISQVLWGSIGFSLPAAVGAAFAAEDAHKQTGEQERRTVLFIGDGSLQLTVQSISDAARWNIKPYIFILNNRGYTIEKLIHGRHEDYNQIQPWDHQLLLKLFADKTQYENHVVKSAKDLDALMKDEAFNKEDKIRVIELFLDEFDAPEILVAQAKLSDEINSKAA